MYLVYILIYVSMYLCLYIASKSTHGISGHAEDGNCE